MRKKGQLAELDLIIAITLLIAGLLLIKGLYIQPQEQPTTQFKANDALLILQTQTVGEIDESFIANLQTQLDGLGVEVKLDENLTIARQLAMLTVAAEKNANQQIQIIAGQLANQALREALPQNNYNITLLSNNQRYDITTGALPDATTITQARMPLSGLQVNKPVEGNTARLRITRATSTRNAYAYLGGFVGQGNITLNLEIPNDAHEITQSYIEGDFHEDFEVRINGANCQTIAVPDNPEPFSYITQQILPESCTQQLRTGSNSIELLFTDGELQDQYAGGGYFRATYTTTNTYQPQTTTKKQYLPGIKGLFNLYDALYIPGELQELEVYLHYNNTLDTNNSLYFALGNHTLYKNNETGIRTITLDNQNITNQGFDYEGYTNKTLPLRFGYQNISEEQTGRGAADAIAITDVSGSMGWEMTSGSTGNVVSDCTDTEALNDPETRRLSVAKCSDKNFTRIMFDSGQPNRVGLVSYNGNTHETYPLSGEENEAQLITEIEGYWPGGGTCICCGILSALDMIKNDLETETLIDDTTTWNYIVNPQQDELIDNEGNNWTTNDYDDNTWQQRQPPITEEEEPDYYEVDFWESTTDRTTHYVEFEQPLNSTANTYGWNQPQDGWDTSQDQGPFEYQYPFDSIQNNDGRLELKTLNDGTINHSSGAAALHINITEELYEEIQNEGQAILSFDYTWEAEYPQQFENADQIWIKGRITTPTGQQYWLGTQQDQGHNGADANPEIATEDNPRTPITGYHQQNLTPFIQSTGNYYLELGGKLTRSQDLERGTITIDNLLLHKNIPANNYRILFTPTQPIRGATLNLQTATPTIVYLNGELITNQFTTNNPNQREITPENWEINLPAHSITTGQNTLAIRQVTGSTTPLAVTLNGYIDDERTKAMLVMSDGQAYAACSNQLGTVEDLSGFTEAEEDAVAAACKAVRELDMNIYTVAFSSSADIPTMGAIAECDEVGNNYSGSDSETLHQVYQEIANRIIQQAQYDAQVITFEEQENNTELFADSYVEYTYIPHQLPALRGQLLINGERTPFNAPNACDSQDIHFAQAIKPIEGHVISYSSHHWTDLFALNAEEIYNLADYAEEYQAIGDPFVIGIPPGKLNQGPNTITLRTADDPDTPTGCSPHNKLHYTAAINTTISLNEIYENAEGCSWTVTFPTQTRTILLPSDYTGSNTCSYTTSNIAIEDNQDVWQALGLRLFSTFDTDNDGITEVDFTQEDLELNMETATEIPYMWGPALLEVSVWG